MILLIQKILIFLCYFLYLKSVLDAKDFNYYFDKVWCRPRAAYRYFEGNFEPKREVGNLRKMSCSLGVSQSHLPYQNTAILNLTYRGRFNSVLLKMLENDKL